MAHMNIKDLGNGYVQITAKRGYYLYSLKLQRAVSEAVVKESQIKDFEARRNA